MRTTRSSRSVTSSGQKIPPGYSDATAKYFEQLSQTAGEEVGIYGFVRTGK
ncbi:MAG: hypothetical protein WDO73_15555 [Ignavibacteriota bacterium]